jgi:predicted acylesterase/phospholipase RssA
MHRRGPLAEAVLASFCLPGIGPPVAMGDRLLVDGGVMDNLPVESAAETGEGPVMASDVTAVFELPARRPRTGAAAERLRGAVLGRGARSPLRLPEVIIRSITVGSSDTVQAGKRHADVVIRPDVGDVGMLAFDQIDRVIEAGRRAARKAISPAG